MTSTDLKAYNSIIASMKGLLNSAEFEQTFNELTAELPKSKQFLLKMELKRLAQPCNYFIDLRGHVDGEVKPHQYMEKTHYLDDIAKQIFEEGVAAYGKYTLGVYEDVMNAENNYRVRHRRETEERVKNQLENLRRGNTALESTTESSAETTDVALPNKLVQFGQYIKRQEERMNFGIEVEVQLPEQRFSAMTSDLSVLGCKLKISTVYQVKVGQVLRLVLKGLEKEYMLDLHNGLDYKVLEIDEQGKYAYLRLQRLAPEQEPQFNQFLKSYINGNKRRYKVNLDNTSDAVLTKGYEQYYLPRINTLAVFISVIAGAVESRFCLTSEFNKPVWHYFLDEQQASVLNQVLSVRRLKQILSLPTKDRACILYSFTHAAKGKLHFYVATDFELAASPALREMFFGFGAGKPSWKVFHLNLLRTHVQNSSVDFAIPGTVVKAPLSPLILSVLEDMHYIVGLTEISSAEHRRYYAGHNFNPAQLAALNKFGLAKPKTAIHCEAVPIHYINLRSESRYLYKTTVQIQYQADLPPVQAFSRDFSVGGLQIELSHPIDCKVGDVLLLTLPDLQKITTKHQLVNLPYEVMAISKSHTVMNLKNTRGDANHGKQFFKQLIQTNRSKLTVAEETPKHPGLSEALRNMYMKSLNNFIFFVHRHGLKHDINVIARGAQPNALHKLLQLAQPDKSRLDLGLVTKNQLLNQEIANQIKQMKRHEAPKVYELFIKITKNAYSRLEFISYFDFEFSSADEQKLFILDTIKHHTLFSFRLFVSRTGKLDSDYIAKEIGYISVYAIHKAKSLEEELWQVEAVVDSVETSAEVVARYNLSACEQQQLERLKILSRDR